METLPLIPVKVRQWMHRYRVIRSPDHAIFAYSGLFTWVESQNRWVRYELDLAEPTARTYTGNPPSWKPYPSSL